MEIGAVKIVDSTANYPLVPKSESVPVINAGNDSNITKNIGSENGNKNSNPTEDSKRKKELNKEQLMKVNEELNHFLNLIESDIQFSIHEKSKQLIVQVVNTKDHSVIKEFPSHEMLDIMANIKEYVGVLLDKRA